ncbi:hypothetical protein ECSTEC94C_2412 [Escherichia coli STEC_94C]|nr:hypothetical protein ECSTEC94C_2412 [Escherichia coli STEC_94C]
MINNGSCGFICNNKDKFDINKYMGVNITGIDMVNEKYSFDVISEKTFNIYMKLIGEK